MSRLSIAIAGLVLAAAGIAHAEPTKAERRAALLDRLVKAKAAMTAAGEPPAGATATPPTFTMSADDIKAFRETVDTQDDVAAASHCNDPLVWCLDREGKPIHGDKIGRLQPGDKLTVVVITDNADDRAATSVTFAGRKSDEGLFPPADQIANDLALRAIGHESMPANVFKDIAPSYVALSFVSDAIANDAIDLTVDLVRTSATPIDLQWDYDVDLGFSYFSVALLVAATYKADRTVFRDLTTSSDHAVEPGLALEIFPGGRQNGVIGYLRHCWDHSWSRCFANTVGIQLGTSLDLTHATERVYTGIVFEPIAGLAISGGVALRKVDVVAPSGAIPAVEDMDGNAPSARRYVVRGYIGVSFTLDLLTTIVHTGTAIRNLGAE